jgi:HD superfamily phosphohydrolase
MTHRDEIHGDVVYDPLAVALLDSPVFQRLGRVYQLGYGHLVYRGATHTRLSHSLGAYYTAGRLVAALRQNYGTKGLPPDGAVAPDEFLPAKRPAGLERTDPTLLDALSISPRGLDSLDARWTVLQHLVGWAGLLHDIGHVPMGHTLEDEFEGIYLKHDDVQSPRLTYLWFATPDGRESEVRRIFRRTELYPEAFRIIGIEQNQWEDVWAAVFLICMFKERIGGRGGTFLGSLDPAVPMAKVLSDCHDRVYGTLFFPYMADIVANTISADYLDYLRRDPRNLGLDVLRDDRVVSRFWVGRDRQATPQLRMALSLVDRRGKPRLDTCTGVVELVRQRYRFAEIVYYHKTKVAASAMLAKVFQLVEAPDEIPAFRDIPRLGEVPKVVDDLIGLRAARSKRFTPELQKSRQSFLPSALLDPEVGDESLPVMLMHRAWALFAEAVANEEHQAATSALEALSLLDLLVRRDLYKVAVTIDSRLYRDLEGQSQEAEGERSLDRFIRDLRKDAAARTTFEQQMIDVTRQWDPSAAEESQSTWPHHALLLYVPPRKSQAKGIETGALDAGRVITLGQHEAVERDVEQLNKKYRDLWRLIILVHPDHQYDAVSLSAAVDAFVANTFEGVDLRDPRVEHALMKACWFHYFPGRKRRAAEEYRAVLNAGGVFGADIDWLALDAAEKRLEVDGRRTDDEIAYFAVLDRRVASRLSTAGQSNATDLLRRYEPRHVLAQRLEEVISTLGSQVESREGIPEARQRAHLVLAALDVIAEELAF